MIAITPLKNRTLFFCFITLLSSTFLLAQSETVANNTTDTTVTQSCSPLMMFGGDVETAKTIDNGTEEERIEKRNAAINRAGEGDDTRAVQTDRSTAPLAIAENQNIAPPEAIVVREPAPPAAVVVRRPDNLGIIRNHPLVRTGIALVLMLAQLERQPIPPVREIFGWEANKPFLLASLGYLAIRRIQDGSAGGAVRDMFPSAYKSYLEPVCNKWSLSEQPSWYNFGASTLQNTLMCPGSYTDFHTIKKELCTYSYDVKNSFRGPRGYCTYYSGALMTLEMFQKNERNNFPPQLAIKDNVFKTANLYKQAVIATAAGRLAEAELWSYAAHSLREETSWQVRLRQSDNEDVNNIREERFDSKQDIIRCAQQASQWYILAAQVEVDPLEEHATNEDIQKALHLTPSMPFYKWREATGTPENIKRTKLSNIGAAFMLAKQSYQVGEMHKSLFNKEAGDSEVFFSPATIQHARQTALLFEEAAKLAISSIGDAETCLPSEEQEERYQFAVAKFEEAKDSHEEDVSMMEEERRMATSTSEQNQETGDDQAS